MNLNRRKMLATIGFAASSATIAKLGASGLSSPKLNQSLASGKLSGPVCLADFEPLAKSHMSHFAYEYISSGAADELTLRRNREAYDQILLRPRVLVDVEKIDTRVTLLGET